ncbi:Protein PDE-4 d [Aphelenchoides avenae]|nr:Protein PDE-4 d [Aphelenchus avenae]
MVFGSDGCPHYCECRRVHRRSPHSVPSDHRPSLAYRTRLYRARYRLLPAPQGRLSQLGFLSTLIHKLLGLLFFAFKPSILILFSTLAHLLYGQAANPSVEGSSQPLSPGVEAADGHSPGVILLYCPGGAICIRLTDTAPSTIPLSTYRYYCYAKSPPNSSAGPEVTAPNILDGKIVQFTLGGDPVSRGSAASPAGGGSGQKPARKRGSMFGLHRKDLHLHHFFQRHQNSPQQLRFSPPVVSGSGAAEAEDSAGSGCGSPRVAMPGRHYPGLASSSSSSGFHHLGVTATHARRESFLYRMDDHRDLLAGSTCRPVSRASSIASGDPQHNDDLVTPFAQLLASLRNVRANLIAISNLPPSADDTKFSTMPRRPPLHNTPLPPPVVDCAHQTLEELDWCLTTLEAIQIHRSVSEMASSKFRKLLNKELSHFAESSKSGTQISRYLVSTYMDDRGDEDLIINNESQDREHRKHNSVPSDPSTSASGKCASPQISLFNKAKTAAMSRISGVRKLHKLPNSHTGPPPEYGVECQKEIAVYMQRLNDWGVNIFRIHELSKQHSLTAVTYTLLKDRGLLKHFEIPPSTLVTYLMNLEHHYKDNPYHNQIHGADVAQSIHVLVSSPALQGVFSDLEVLAAIFSAAIHDVDHPGFTNQYLINSSSELAIMYNDESVLEQHHLAVAFKLLQDPSCDFLVGLTKKQRQAFRKIVIAMVLATDMSKHMSLLADLKTMVEAKKVSGSSAVNLDKYNDRIQVLQSMIHLADLSNPTKPIELYRQWNERILEEYWRQGDREKEQGLQVSPMCDRGNVTIEKSQVGFIDYIVHPLFETWADLVYPDAQTILDQLEENRQWYLARIPESERSTDEHNGHDDNVSRRESGPEVNHAHSERCMLAQDDGNSSVCCSIGTPGEDERVLGDRRPLIESSTHPTDV